MDVIVINSFFISLLATPFIRKIAIKFNLLDHPTSEIKSHSTAIPYLGGLAIMLGIITSLLIYTFSATSSSEVLSWRLFLPLVLLFALGTYDDIVNISARFRFLIQATVFILLIELLDLYIPMSGITLIDKFFTLFWLIGITNAFNIIDIMDGLSSGVAIIVAATLGIFGFLQGYQIVVLLSLATAGSALGFIGYNFSKKLKIFMGDGGSTLLGSALGIITVIFCKQSAQPVTDFIALFILFGIPIYDTLLVIILRIRKGLSPFKGSRDHFALRMVEMGFSNTSTVISVYIVTLALSFVSFVVQNLSLGHAVLLLTAVGLFGITWGRMLSIIDIKK